MTLDRLAQRWGVNPLSLVPDGNMLDWSLLMEIAQAGSEQDRRDRDDMQADIDGKSVIREVKGETRLSKAVKRKKAKRVTRGT